MRDQETDKIESSTSETEKKKKRKSEKVKSKTDSPPVVDNKEARDAIASLLQNTVKKYADITDNQLKSTRDDFESLQTIVSEFLEDYIIIGHTLDGQRVVIRYTASPAALDGLTELCKKVLIRMMQQEQMGQ